MIDIEGLFRNLNNNLQKFVNNTKYNRMMAYHIQMNLLECIIEIENEIRTVKDKILFNKSISNDKSNENEVRKKFSIEAKELKELSIMYKEGIKRLREIGDSIAFAYFNKADLKSLCWKQSSGFITGKDGLQNELSKLKSIFELGGFAILNDITNSLRYGDITVDNNGVPQLLEIKSSDNKNERIIRQQKDIGLRMEMLNNNSLESFLGTDRKFQRVYLKKVEVNYIEELQELIDEAINKGSVVKEMEEGLVYSIYYKQNNFNDINTILSRMAKPKIFYINMMKNVNENYTPFPMIIKNNDYLIEFYEGNLIISIFVDIEVIKRKIQNKGYLFNVNENGEFVITFNLNGESTSLNTSEYHIWKIGREFLSLDSFIDGMENVIIDIRK